MVLLLPSKPVLPAAAIMRASPSGVLSGTVSSEQATASQKRSMFLPVS